MEIQAEKENKSKSGAKSKKGQSGVYGKGQLGKGPDSHIQTHRDRGWAAKGSKPGKNNEDRLKKISIKICRAQ